MEYCPLSLLLAKVRGLGHYDDEAWDALCDMLEQISDQIAELQKPR